VTPAQRRLDRGPPTISNSALQPFRRCASRFAVEVAGNVEEGEPSTLRWLRLEIGLDENLDGLFAGMNLDANGRVTEVYLVP